MTGFELVGIALIIGFIGGAIATHYIEKRISASPQIAALHAKIDAVLAAVTAKSAA